MNTNIKGLLRGLAAAAAIGAIALPVAAQAQEDDQIQGTIAAVTGTYSIEVNDARGFVDNVALHDGTIINPTGLTLAAGQPVTILGEPDGNVFVADEIDTPYNTYPAYYAPAPVINLGFVIGGGRPGYVANYDRGNDRGYQGNGDRGYRGTPVSIQPPRAIVTGREAPPQNNRAYPVNAGNNGNGGHERSAPAASREHR
jgi:hypothetical protein